MNNAWQFWDRPPTTQVARERGHGRGMKGDAETHSLALAALGALIFEWDAIEDDISRPLGLRSLYGYPLGEIEPTLAWMRGLIHPDDAVRERATFHAQVAAQEPVVRGSYRVRHRDGRWINVRTAGAAQYDAQGRLLRLVGCTLDSEETTMLEEAHARLAAVVQHSGDAILSLDREGLIQTWNGGAARLYGYSAQEIVGAPLTKIVPESERADSKAIFDAVVAGETRVFQGLRRRKDGTEVVVEISGAAILAPDGRVMGVSAIHRDIAAARDAALADARFAAVVRASHDAIVTLDGAGVVQFWNRGAEELFGWSASEAIGQPIDLIVPEDRANEHAALVAKIAGGESIVCETARVTKAGARVAVLASFTPYVDGGAHAGTAVTFRDIGERLARDTHIHVLLKELSHRSKNLLAIVQGIARQSAMRTSDFQTFLENFTARLRALAHSHDLLVQRDWHGADMHALVAMQTGAFEIAEDVLRVTGDPMLVKPEAAQNIGLSLHELASNALRHGALSTPDGHVEIDWALFDRAGEAMLRLSWRERNGPPARLPKRGGFGILVVSQITPRALGGEATLVADDEGLSWTLEAPAANVLGSTG